LQVYWEGPHCQFFKSNAIPLSAATSQASSPSNSNSTIFAILGVLCVLLVAALVGFVVWRSQKRKNYEENELLKEIGKNHCDKATDDGSVYSGELEMISRHII
jgi:high-affinity Fe2+/Pb2+ permease